MAKRKDFTLTDEELETVDLAIRRDKRTGLARRATAVRLLHLGHKPEAVAEMVAASIPSVYGWHERFRQGGVDGLANKQKKPRRRKVTGAYLEQLDQALEQEPDAFGYVRHLESRTVTGPSGARDGHQAEPQLARHAHARAGICLPPAQA